MIFYLLLHRINGWALCSDILEFSNHSFQLLGNSRSLACHLHTKETVLAECVQEGTSALLLARQLGCQKSVKHRVGLAYDRKVFVSEGIIYFVYIKEIITYRPLQQAQGKPDQHGKHHPDLREPSHRCQRRAVRRCSKLHLQGSHQQSCLKQLPDAPVKCHWQQSQRCRAQTGRNETPAPGRRRAS